MYFDATGKYVSHGEMHKSMPNPSYDIVNNTNRMCKGKCVQFKASKPVTGGRYEAGQYRCQTCEIYLTEHGVDGHSCKCCNMRVRSKPRNSLYKEKYHDRVRNAKDPWIIENKDEDVTYSPKVNSTNNSGNEKKSTPIYEEIDESVKTYYELKEFLEHKIKPQANYQFVILKELLEYGELHKGELAESLAYFNNKDTTNIDVVKYYFDVPVYDVLLNHGFIVEDEGVLDIQYYSLNVKLEEFQKIQLIEYLTNSISQYNEVHNIPENQYPNANNMGNIFWSNSNIKHTSNISKIQNFVKKILPPHTNSYWIWSVIPENWEIVKSKNIWGSRIQKERIGTKVKSGDQIAFYVIGTNCFKGIFEFVGEWFDSTGETWVDDLEPDGSLRYKSKINLKPIILGSVNVSDLYEKLDLFIGRPQNIRNLILQGGSGYPSNNSRTLSKEDFGIMLQHLVQNPERSEIKVDPSSKIVKECPKCHDTKVEGFPGIEFDNKVEELFGYRQFDPSDPETRKPQSYCRVCRSSQHSSQTSNVSEDKFENEIIPTVSHICSKCKETKVEGIPGTEDLDNKIDEHFGFKFSYLVNSPDSKKPITICRQCSRKAGQEYRSKIRNETYDQVKDTSVQSSDITDTRIFNFDGDTLNIKNCKVLSANTIQKDQILTNDDIVSTFKVGNMGGIRYTKENDVIVLLSTYSNDYDDTIDIDSRLIIYTGEGKENQELKNGNEKILNSQNTPMVFFKEVYQEPGARPRGTLDNKYQFIGLVKYQKHYWKTEKGRTVVKFVLEILS